LKTLIVILVCGHLHLFDILRHYKAPIHTADVHDTFPVHYASQLCGISVDQGSKKGIMKLRGIDSKFVFFEN
jgi:hypothetical protein